jgi:hypothetical protein
VTRRKKNPVAISFVKVDAAARRHRETHRFRATMQSSKLMSPVRAEERELLDLWMDIIPDGLTPLDWFRAWNDSYPDEQAVDIYNHLHPDENEQISLEGEDEDG